VWVEDSLPESGSGSCNAVVADCPSIPDKDMCLTTGAAGSNTCFWLKDTAITTYGGKCRDTNANNLLCSDVADMSECTDDILKNTILNGKCGDYGGVCKLRCEYVTISGEDICNGRTDECFWLKGSSSTSDDDVCVEKV
jgi:hypothetical protein